MVRLENDKQPEEMKERGESDIENLSRDTVHFQSRDLKRGPSLARMSPRARSRRKHVPRKY